MQEYNISYLKYKLGNLFIYFYLMLYIETNFCFLLLFYKTSNCDIPIWVAFFFQKHKFSFPYVILKY